MKCEKCQVGEMIVKQGQHGAFMACDQFPNCKNTAKVNLPQGAAVPVPVVPMNLPTASGEFSYDTPVPKPKKEFHLSPEQVRTNAMDLAIKMTEPTLNLAIVMQTAIQIEEYLWNGK